MRTRLVLLAPIALLLSACSLLPSSPAKPHPTPSPTSGVAAVQTPSPAVTVEGVITATEGSCGCLTLHLFSLSGTAEGSTVLPAGPAPGLSGGAQGGYFVSGNLLMRMVSGGSLNQVGTVAGSSSTALPGSGPGALAIAPGGGEWGYLDSTGSGSSETERVWLGEPGVTPKLLVSSAAGPAQISTEYPGGWQYQLLGWAGGYLVLAQEPLGSTSFAGSFPEVWLVNPENGHLTLVSNSVTCPVSAVSSTGEYACFQQGGGMATELVTGSQGFSSGSWSLPPAGGYGSAVFDPSGGQILFSLCAGCGPTPSAAYLKSQMEILDTATGALTPIGPLGLVPDAWIPGGPLVATQYSRLRYSRSGTAPVSEVVLVNPASGAVTALDDDSGSEYVGLSTS